MLNGSARAIESAIARWGEGVGLDLSFAVFGHTLAEYLASVVVFAAAFVAFKVLQWLVLRKVKALAERTATELDDTFVKMVASFRPPFYAFLAFWLAVQYLGAHGVWAKILTAVAIVWAVYQAVITLGILVEDLLLKKIAKDKDPNTQAALRLLANFGKGALWGLGIVLLLANLGVDVSSLLAGVGIGGIAIAFAVQGILSDLFNSFSLYFDKPFVVGDFIVLPDGKMGTVKHIGLKSTRVTSLTGEEIVVPNSVLTGSSIQNFKRMQERRITFTLGVGYHTSVDKLRRALQVVREAIEARDQVRFDRVHFKQFGDFALIIEAVYYLQNPDYTFYMDTQQAINFAIKEAFEKEGIAIAFPTQTVYLRKDVGDLSS